MLFFNFCNKQYILIKRILYPCRSANEIPLRNKTNIIKRFILNVCQQSVEYKNSFFIFTHDLLKSIYLKTKI